MIFLYFFSIGLFILLSFLLCLVILMQESKTTGLGASFGGETTESLFGASTADVLKKFTAWLSAIFFAACLLLSLWTAALGPSKTTLSPYANEVIEQPEQ